MKRSRRGFAVVLAVALLAAIMLLLLALTALTRQELRASVQRGAAAQARLNAQLGLRIALGRLQEAAGPDACSTATARGARNPQWTGVWGDVGAPVWLVSGSPTDPDQEIVTSGVAADGTLLVGANTTPAPEDSVAARFEDIVVAGVPGLAGEQAVGRFAFWIGDEGVKGHVGVVDRVDEVPVPGSPAADDPVTDLAERARLRQLVAHRSGNDALNFGGEPPTSGFQLQAEDDPDSAARWALFGAALTHNQLRFQELGTAKATENYRTFVRRHFHDFTVHSLGVLADAAQGGLRRNFSDLGASEVPAAVVDLERYRPEAGRLPVAGGTAGGGEATAQIKPIITEWALDFVPYREDRGSRLLVGCRLRLELWNPFNLPLAHTLAGAPDYRVRVTGLPTVRVQGPDGAAGEFDLGALLGPTREIVVDVPGDLGAGQFAVVTAVVASGADSGLQLDDPTPTDPGDDVLEIASSGAEPALLRFELFSTAGATPALTMAEGFPAEAFVRRSPAGSWSVAGNAPFGGAEALVRLGVSYHFRLDPARGTWADWIAPSAPGTAGPDLKRATVAYAPEFWKSVAVDPAANAEAASQQFAAGEIFATGRTLCAYDFTVQRNLSIAALAQFSEPGERAFGVGNPWGGARNAVFDAAYFNPVPESWIPGQRLPNVRHRVLDWGGAPPPSAADLGGLGAARHLGVDGQFNVNATSARAWTVALGRTVLGWTAADGTVVNLENPFFVFGQSAPFAPPDVRGVRQFSDEAIQALATELARRIAARPRPFRSLAEFVNSGVLQAAIDAAGLNTRPEFCADLGGIAPARWSANWLSQAAVLNTLAPLLAVRSDTFLIRVCGEALNPALEPDDRDRVAARAWCEAVVQRLPEYVDPREDAVSWPSVRIDNVALGRQFRIVAFRWLGPEDI